MSLSNPTAVATLVPTTGTEGDDTSEQGRAQKEAKKDHAEDYSAPLSFLEDAAKAAHSNEQCEQSSERHGAAL
jgi:hypothetical protein